MKIFIFLVGIGWDWGILGSNNLMNWWDINPPFMYCVFHHISDHLQRLILFWQFYKKVGIRSDPPFFRKKCLVFCLITLKKIRSMFSRLDRGLVQKAKWSEIFRRSRIQAVPTISNNLCTECLTLLNNVGLLKLQWCNGSIIFSRFAMY